MAQALFIIRVAASANPVVPVFLGSQDEFNRRTSFAVSALAAGSMLFVGQICLMAQSKAPPGWLICDGSAVSRTGFPALFAEIGTLYGAGDGILTFNLPTQAQCVPPAVAPTPPQEIIGGSVVPPVVVDPPVSDNPVGGTGGNSVTGGRPPYFDNFVDIP